MDYETIIGLEVHAQLTTRSKMYCGCSTDYVDAPPNTHVCPVCLGMPGVLPVINRRAIEYNIMTGLALHCEIPENTKFDRKNYPYPDLMKGYQISQYDMPLCVSGWLEIDTEDGGRKRIGITRVHQEEDVAKMVHRTDPSGESYSLVDVNRAGVPLMEIVSEPDIRSPEEARQYLMKLRSILRYLGVSTADMEKGSFRCDANISVRPKGSDMWPPKVEVKNMNSFRAVFRALSYEEQRQRETLDKGGRVVQETRGWVEEKGITVSQRSKEEAHDYRYFPEPDLPPMVVGREWVEELRERLPELPDARRERFMEQYALSGYDADLLTFSREMADYFERTVALVSKNGDSAKKAKTVANWLLGEMTRMLNVTGTDVAETKVQPEHLVELIGLVESGTLSINMAKSVFEEMFNTGKRATVVVEEKGLVQISDTSELENTVAKVLADNPGAVEDYHSGKEQALKFLMGQVMRATKGQANPKVVGGLLQKKLGEGQRV